MGGVGWGAAGRTMHTSGARGPPLLCLGRKGRDPRRGPVNGSIVSEPSVALGVPGPPGPPPLSSSCRPSGAAEPTCSLGWGKPMLCVFGVGASHRTPWGL